MFLLSKFLPFLKRPRKQTRPQCTFDNDLPCLGDKTKSDIRCKVLLLDDTEVGVHAKSNGKGELILGLISDHLNLIEREYFGLRYLDNNNQTHWLDPSKSIGGQLKNVIEPTLYFGVKFYAADPCKLQEEITRYQVFLQVKRDVLQGRLPVSFDTAAELASFALQSELGDYDPKRHSFGYVSELRFVPNQSEELEVRAMHIHRTLAGQVPSVAEYRYLDKVKWLDMYGVDLHPVQGEGNVEYFVGLTPTGVVVYRNKSKVGNYFWPRITKVTFRGKVFMVRVKDKNNEENTYAFECNTKSACKHLWKCCVEHHAFFRLSQAHHSFQAHKLLGFGSKHRYSGRSERQVLGDNQQATVVRNPSKRHSRRPSLDSKCSNMGDDNQGFQEVAVAAPADLGPRGMAPDSPRSTKSAPWESGHHRKGMYTSGRESPLSLRSEKLMFPTRRPQSGSDGEGGSNKKRVNRRVDSETESEVSTRRNRRRERRNRGVDSGSESESSYYHRVRHSRRSTENLPQSEIQWRNMQHQMNGHAGPRPHGSVSSMPGSEMSHHSKKSRRRRSKSPGNKRPPEELAQHFKYVEADPSMSTEQLRGIPYTKVETNVQPIKLKHSPNTRHRNRGQRPRSHYSDMVDKRPTTAAPLPAEEAPPPYSSPQRPSSFSHSLRPSYPNMQHQHAYSNHGGYEDRVQPPAAAYRNEAHTAPIVKTKMAGPGGRQMNDQGTHASLGQGQGQREAPGQLPPYLEPAVPWRRLLYHEPVYQNIKLYRRPVPLDYLDGYFCAPESLQSSLPPSSQPYNPYSAASTVGTAPTYSYSNSNHHAGVAGNGYYGNAKPAHSYQATSKPAYIEQASSRPQSGGGPPHSMYGNHQGGQSRAYLPPSPAHGQPAYGKAHSPGYGSAHIPNYSGYNHPSPYYQSPATTGMHPAMAAQFSPQAAEGQAKRNRDMMTEL